MVDCKMCPEYANTQKKNRTDRKNKRVESKRKEMYGK